MIPQPFNGRQLIRGPLTLAFLLAAGAVVAAPQATRFSKGPYLQAPGSTTMTLLWECPEDLPAKVRYGRGKHLDQVQEVPPPRAIEVVSQRQGSPTPGGGTATTFTKTVYLYDVPLHDLRPDTTYAYLVELGPETSGVRQFRTFGQSPKEVQFIVYGDSRSQPEVHAAVARRFPAYQPDFILHTGDLVARGRDYDLWGREFFGPLADVIDHIPILPAIGNHEQDGAHYLSYFHLPPPERWYSFDLGPVHVLALDYHYPEASHEQFAFAQQDLRQSQAPWKIVFLHYPVFNIGGHASTWGHDAYLPLFHETGVDIVVGGHSHVYERFHPIMPLNGEAKYPIVHLTSGGGGANLYPVYDHPALATKASTNHFIVLETSRNRLKGTAYLTSGEVLDRFELRKQRGQPTPKWLAQAYPEEWLRATFEGASMLRGKVDSPPSTTESTDVLLTLRPLATAPATMEWEIHLAPESTPYYAQTGPPVRVTTPPVGAPDQLLRIPILATDRRPISARPGRDLSPSLVFQARARSGDIQFVIRGRASYRSSSE